MARLGLVLVGQFMVVLDASIVNVALPSIQRDLHFSTSGLQWIVNAYTLTFAGFLLLGGRAADLFGRRRIFLLGLGVFTASSLLGGMAQSEAWLITARAIQGLGAAILAPATLTILTATFAEGPARARALGAWSAVSSAGASAGALFGGILTEFLNWRWILFVNVPIGVVALVAARRYVPESKAELAHRHLDLAGAVTVTAGLVSFVYAIVRTETYPWGSPQVLVPMAIGLALIAGFLLLQARVSKAPLVPLRIFRSRSVSGANAVMFLLFGALFGSWYFETLYMQHVLGFSPLQAGLAFLPQTLLIAAGAQIVSRLVSRMGPRPLILVGTLVAAVGPGVDDPDHTAQHVPGRPVRPLRPHRPGHGSHRHPRRRRRHGRRASGRRRSRLGPPEHLADGRRLHRAGGAGHAGRQTDGRGPDVSGQSGPRGRRAQRRVHPRLRRGRRGPRRHRGRRHGHAALAASPPDRRSSGVCWISTKRSKPADPDATGVRQVAGTGVPAPAPGVPRASMA